MSTRQPATMPKFTKAQIAQAIKADDTKRAAKTKAKRKAKKDVVEQQHDAEREQAAVRDAAYWDQAGRDPDAEQAAYIAALKVDAQALIDSGAWTESVEAYVAKELDLPADSGERKQREQTYFGPMLALRAASKSYVKATNGILCNGDRLAMECGKYSRAVVVDGLVRALIEAKLEAGNRYAHMNPGQQSMNLRNRVRHQLAAGTITWVEVVHGLETAATLLPADVK